MVDQRLHAGINVPEHEFTFLQANFINLFVTHHQSFIINFFFRASIRLIVLWWITNLLYYVLVNIWTFVSSLVILKRKIDYSFYIFSLLNVKFTLGCVVSFFSLDVCSC